MDNAGNGLRGLRAKTSQKLLAIVSDRYAINCVNDPVDLGGSANLNLCIDDGEAYYVVRVYRPYVTTARLRTMHFVRQQLTRAGVPCGGLRLTCDQQPWIYFENRLVEVEAYVEHDTYMDEWERLEAGLPTLGRIHTVLRGLEVSAAAKTSAFANHIEATDVLARTLHGTRRIRSWRASAFAQQLADQAETLASRVSGAERAFRDHLPRQLVHGDFWDNNVLFRDKSLVFVADFDFMGERARIDDLALTLYFTCMKFREEAVSDKQLYQLARLLDAYEAGADNPLTTVERAALPVAIARQPLWSIGGWVALLDDEETARQHAVGTAAEVEWALQLMNEVSRWQTAFAY